MTQFLKGTDGNGNGCSGHDAADHHCLEEIFASPWAESIEYFIQQGAADQRYQYACTGDQKSDYTGAFQILNTGFQSGREHQQNNADFCHNRQKVGLLDNSQNTRTNDQAGYDLTDNLWCAQFAGQNTKGFSEYNDNTQIP